MAQKMNKKLHNWLWIVGTGWVVFLMFLFFGWLMAFAALLVFTLTSNPFRKKKEKKPDK